MHTPQRTARTAGLYYLVVAVCGGFAQIVREQVHVRGDAATTTDNVIASARLVQFSFVADLVAATAMLAVVLTLYELLKHVNGPMARAMVILVIVSSAITCLNMVFQYAALTVATDPVYTGAFTHEGGEAAVLFLLNLQHTGYLIAQIFFGSWLLPLGVLAIRSALFPRALGMLLIAATPAYLLQVALEFLAPKRANTVSSVLVLPVVILAEVSMLIYLLVKGVRTTAPVSASPLAQAVSSPERSAVD